MDKNLRLDIFSFGCLAPMSIVFRQLGLRVNLALYGLETIYPLSLIGLWIISLFVLKGIVAFGLWFEKQWAASVALVDAILGIIICTLVTLVVPLIAQGDNMPINIRLELIALIPYLFKMRKIRTEWIHRVALS